MSNQSPPSALAHISDAPEEPQGYRASQVWRIDEHGETLAQPDQVAVETAVALEYNGLSHAVMLATPTDLEDLAWGFSFTEGVIQKTSDLYDIDIEYRLEGVVVQIRMAQSRVHALKQRRRQLAGRTGCGLCGLESLAEVRRPLKPVQSRRAPLHPDALLFAARQLLGEQPLHQVTGATHAAAWADRQGHIIAVREDVGRHNAFDKLIGHMLRHQINPEDGLAILSSRASFEMVQKAAAAGISLVAAVSAPTSYAIRIADELNILLAGFVRDQRFTVYTHPQHLAKGHSVHEEH